MSHVPVYVYVLFAVLVWLGVARCFPRTIRVERLALMPVLMTVLALRGYTGLFPAAGLAAIAAGLAGLAVGIALGIRQVRRWDVRADRIARTLSLPGDGALLAIILATFVFEFVLHYGIEARASWVASPFTPLIAAAIWGAFVGMSAGRNLDLTKRYLAAR